MFQHRAEHAVGIRPTARLPQRVLVVHPSEDDDLGPRVEAEEKTEMAQKLCAAPTSLVLSQSVSLLELCVVRFGRDLLEYELDHAREKFRLVVRLPGVGVVRRAQGLDLRRKRVQTRFECGMRDEPHPFFRTATSGGFAFGRAFMEAG